MEEEVSTEHVTNDLSNAPEPVTNDISNENEEEEESSSPQLTVLTTVAYDYTDLPDSKPFDRMDIDNHNVTFDDSNQVSSTTESTPYEPPAEPSKSVSDSPDEKVQAVENNDLQCPPKEESKSVSKRDKKRAPSPNATPGKSRYGRVRKQKLSTDFVISDRKSFTVLNSNSYEPVNTESPEKPLKLSKPKRAYRKKKYVVENGSTIGVQEGVADESSLSNKISVEDDLTNLEDESSRSSLNVSAIKTYSRKGDVTVSVDEKPGCSTDAENVVHVNYPELNWKVGDVAWAKIGCYPYWPSIVTLEYGTSIYVKPVGKQQSRLAVHVHFFGDKGRRSWVLTTSLMKYESKEQFMELKRQYSKDKLRMKYFVIPPRIEDLWEKAVNEADTILKLPIDERTQYYESLYPMMHELYKNELLNADIKKSTPGKDKSGAETKRGRKRKILNDDKADDSVAPKKVKIENSTPSKSDSTEAEEKKQRESKEKKSREPVDEHTKKRRAFMRRMNQILKQSNAASLPPKKRIKLQMKEEQAFNKLLENAAGERSRTETDNASPSLESKKNDLSVYDFESDEETDVFIGTYNSKFTPQILDQIEKKEDAVEEKPKVPSPSKLPISLNSTTPTETPSTVVDFEESVITPKTESTATALGTPPSTSVKKKMGRPKGTKNKVKVEEIEPPKRKRGRPRKTEILKKKRGRPSKAELLLRKKAGKLFGKKYKSKNEEFSKDSNSGEGSKLVPVPNDEGKSVSKPLEEKKKKKLGRPRKIKLEGDVVTPDEPGKSSAESAKGEGVQKSEASLDTKDDISTTSTVVPTESEEKNEDKRDSKNTVYGGKMLPRKRFRPCGLKYKTKRIRELIEKSQQKGTAEEDSSLANIYSKRQVYTKRRRLSEKAKKYAAGENSGIPTFDLSSDDEDVKSEEEKGRSASPHSASSFRCKKATNVFLGLKNEKVCQICLVPGDTIRCRGPCCGYFHIECDKRSEEIESNASCVKPVSRRGRKRLAVKNANVDPRLVKPIEMNGDVVIKTESLDDTNAEPAIKNSVFHSEASPKNTDVEEPTTNGNSVLDSEAAPKNGVEEECRSLRIDIPDAAIFGVVSVDLTKNNSKDADPVTSTNVMMNGTSSEDERAAAVVSSKKNDENVQSGAQTVSAENEISSSTGEKLNGKAACASVNGTVSDDVACPVSEQTSSTDAPAESSNVPAKTTNGNGVDFYCQRCSKERLYPCLSCGKETQEKTKETLRYTCYVVACGRTYHKECLKEWPQASWGTSSSIKESLRCPQHYCHTCISENPAVLKNKECNEILVRCVKCPTSYHKRVHCLPAGTEILNSSQIICPRHYEPPIGMRQGHINATWCFICCIGGSLICCDECPMSFHAECLKLRPEEYEGRYICDDCQSGRFILYGEIAWVKLGHFRWWPAKVLFPYEVPENIQNLPHRRGEFVVEFFGSHNYNWINRGRAFLYQEGDSGKKSCKRNSVDLSFEKAMAEAENAYKKLKVDKAARDEVARMGMKPPRYARIKANKPVGNVKIIEPDASNVPACECDPNSEKPCSADSDCLNRMLLVECNPLICPAGERCMNQVFEKRVYPPLMPYKTEKRGWGLKTVFDMKKGDFIIEYVGEMIDEEEYKRRIAIMHKKHEENYYFLTIDKERMLDAGPKGNVSRFMNHSCDPNCETQKWTVNGDTRIGLFALKDIPANTELVFNYNLATQGNEKRACYCGSENCSGFIGMKGVKNGNSSTDEESRKKSGEDARKRSGEAGSNAAYDNQLKAKQRRARKLKKKKLLRQLAAAGTGKLAAAKLTTDLRLKMKKRAVLSAVKEQSKPSNETCENAVPRQNEQSPDDTRAVPKKKSQKSTIVRFKKRIKMGRAPKRLKAQGNSVLESSLLKWQTAVGEYTSPETEALFKQKELFRKDPTKVTPISPKEGNENEPYVERRGRKKMPKNVDEKKALFLQILKRRIAQKIERMTLDQVDDKCFKCGSEGELLFCDNNGCPRGYHLACVDKTVWPTGRWLCPWHYCILCNSRSRIIKCADCVNAYCVEHHTGNIFEEDEDRYSCKTHKSENAKQGYFKSVSMMRLPTVKTENDAELTENANVAAVVIENEPKSVQLVEEKQSSDKPVEESFETKENGVESLQIVKEDRDVSNQQVDKDSSSKEPKENEKKSVKVDKQKRVDRDIANKNVKDNESKSVKVVKQNRKLSDQHIDKQPSNKKVRESETKSTKETKVKEKFSDRRTDRDLAKKKKKMKKLESADVKISGEKNKLSNQQMDRNLFKKEPRANEPKPAEAEVIKHKRKLSNQPVHQHRSDPGVKDGEPKSDKVIKKKRKISDQRSSEDVCSTPSKKKLCTENNISERVDKADKNEAQVAAKGDAKPAIVPTDKKISRTARKSIRSSAATYTATPVQSKPENLPPPQPSAEKLEISLSNDEDFILAEETVVQSSDDEFVDVEVEVLNDSD